MVTLGSGRPCARPSANDPRRPWIGLATSFTVFLWASVVPGVRGGQVDVDGPAGSVAFGSQVVALPNGNFVVTDPDYGSGAAPRVGVVHLYDGSTLELLSTLEGSTAEDRVGSGGITVLANGNFVIANGVWDHGTVANAGAP